MLRVRPIHYTSRIEAFLLLFDALGLAPGHRDENWYEFDSGSGRLALHRVPAGSKDDGVTHLGFEVRDMEVFARRSSEAGTNAKVTEAAHGTTVQITGRDGLQFYADATEQLEPRRDAEPKLSVNMMWLSPAVAGAAQDLANIGAKHLNTAINGNTANFAAKNGGKILAHIAGTPAHGPLGFGYHGNVAELLERLLTAGIDAHIIDESYGRTLHIANPDFAEIPGNPTGPTIWINEEDQADQYGYSPAP